MCIRDRPGTPLRVGSTGRAVKEVQYYLYLLSAYFPEIPVIAYDGVFGAATEKAVRAYQQLFGLTVDGIVGRATWDSIYQRFTTLRNVDGPMLNLRAVSYTHLSGSTELVMMPMPVNKRPKPIMIWPMFRLSLIHI